jgi:hypothetical protein
MDRLPTAMGKRKPIEAILQQFLAARQRLLNEKADIERKLRTIHDTLAEKSISLEFEPPVLRRPPHRPVNDSKKQMRSKELPSASTTASRAPQDPSGPEPVLPAENIVALPASGSPPNGSAALEAPLMPPEEQMIELQGSNAALPEDEQKSPPPKLDRIALLRAVNKLIDENPEELPSFKSAGIPPITQRQLIDVKDLFPAAEDLSQETARDTLMSLSLGNALLRNQEIKDFIVKHGIQTIGALIAAIPQMEELKKREQVLLLARLSRRLHLLTEGLMQSPEPEPQMASPENSVLEQSEEVLQTARP